jgi:hypothetical protein
VTADRDQTLTRLNGAAATPGTTLDEVDRRVAAELGVDVGQYFAYLAVAEALDRHAEVRTPEQSDVAWQADDASSPIGRAHDLTAAIGWRAATIYQATATGRSTDDVGQLAAGILGSLLQLRQNLRDLDSLERLGSGVDGGASSRGQRRRLFYPDAPSASDTGCFRDQPHRSAP